MFPYRPGLSRITLIDVVTVKSPVALMILIPALVGCSFSFSAGGPDYEGLQKAIAAELNESYKPMGRHVDAVDCPRQSGKLAAGDTFICKADLEGNPVRVQVTLTDDENADFKTMDTVYDLSATATDLARQISQDQGFAVTVTCGDGVKVVEVGQSFECVAADRRGDTRPVKVTAGAVDQDDKWELLEVD